MAFAAGMDMLAICNDADRIRAAFDAVVRAVREGAIDESAVDRAVRRIATLKRFIGPPPPFDADRIAAISGEIRAFKERL
jgi:beta-glucosidase-like glycosyl hydrolase